MSEKIYFIGMKMGDFTDTYSYYTALLQMIQDNAWNEDEEELLTLKGKMTFREREQYDNTISRLDSTREKMEYALKIFLNKDI